MKKIILPVLFFALVLTSCKKDYTCSCKIEESSSSMFFDYETYNQETTYLEVSKRFVKNKVDCYSTELEEMRLGFNGQFDPETNLPIEEMLIFTTKSTCELEIK